MPWQSTIKSKWFLAVLIVLLAAFSYYFFRELSRQYEIQKQIGAMEEDIMQLEKSSAELEDLVAYFQTEDYKEKELRKRLNLQKEGEHVVVLPENPEATSSTALQSNQFEKNWIAWWNYFFGN